MANALPRTGRRDTTAAGGHRSHRARDIGPGTAGVLPTLVVYAVRRGAERVCLDLSDVERVDRSGAEALRRCTRVARYTGGELAMVAPEDPAVAEVLADSGVSADVPRLATRPRRRSAGR